MTDAVRRRTSDRIADALRGRDHRVGVYMTRDFAAECCRAAQRSGWALETWIVAAMVHMLERGGE